MRWLVVFVLMLSAISAVPVLAADAPSDPSALELPDVAEGGGVEVKDPVPGAPGLTDPKAAKGMPLEELARDEAGELLDSVFAPVLEGLDGPFDELRPEKFLADNVAVMPAGHRPEGETPPDGSEANGAQGPTLVTSTIPLRIESASGKEEVIDLSLEEIDGEFRIANPLVEVDLPKELGEGIELPETGVSIEVEQAPEGRSPSELDHNAILYPNVAEDTDFAIAPAPTGFETLTQLRSADAPTSQTLSLDLPVGASLRATEEGGADVVKDGEAFVGISPPSALDATGAAVPVDMEVSGNSLELTVSPNESTLFPVLVDPLIQSYKWEVGKERDGIHYYDSDPEGWTIKSVGSYNNYPYCTHCPPYSASSGLEPWHIGLVVYSNLYPAEKGDHAAWIYSVPRYLKELKNPPTSFISKMTLSGLTQRADSPYPSPYLTAGLWDVVNKNWVSLLSHTGLKGHHLTDTNWVYNFPNPNGSADVKVGSVGLWAMEDTPNGAGDVRVLSATVELAEMANDLPGFGSISPPAEWVHQTALPIDYVVSDSGLGVYSMTVTPEQKNPPIWKTSHGCTGVSGDACPRTWNSKSAGPVLKYDPSVLPQGVNMLKVIAEDPLGHVSSPAYAQVKVDHTAPSLSISGPLVEVAAVGESWPTYRLDISATDGTKSAPQSGVAKTVVKVDGKVVSEVALGCETESCSSYRSWTLESSKFAAGKHTLDVTATDGVGLSTTKSRTFNLQPAPPPELDLAGSLTEQEALGASRPRYALEISASTEAGQKYEAPAPVAAFEFGKGLLGEPSDVAVDSGGDVWVPRAGENVIKEFDSAGKYLRQIGAYSYTGCGLNGPRDLVIDSADNIWVANGNGRVAKYNAKGECVLVFGGSGKGEASVGNASCIGIAPSGNIWVCDWEGNQVVKFNVAGQYQGRFGSKGTGEGQFSSPNDIAFGPGGEAWISDASRVQKFSAGGQFQSQIDENGWGNGEFYGPSGVATDAEGNLFVVETTNNRVEEFNSEGEYRSHFGHYGTGVGQLHWPTGIAIDSDGDFWIADTHNGRIQKWVAPPRPLEQALKVGGSGSDEGELSSPSGIATDAEGNHWVVDTMNHRVQKFGPEGEFLDQFGEEGSESDQFKTPHGIDIDAEGNLWITDSGNGQIKHFTPEGEYLGQAEKLKGITPEYPTGIAVDAEGTIWVTDIGKGRVVRFGYEGEFLWQWIGSQGSGSGQLDEPYGLDVDHQGNIWVADTGNNRVEKFDEAGNYLGEIGDGGSGLGQVYRPLDVTIDADGQLWVTSSEGGSVEEFSPQGEYLSQFGWGEGGLDEPDGVAVDPDGDVWVVVAGEDGLQEWRAPGVPATLAVSAGAHGSGEGQFNGPTGIATDAEGNHWVVDTMNHRVQKFGPEGEFLDQFGKEGSGPDQFKTPHGIAIDAEGNLWITDSGNGKIKYFTPEGEYIGEAEKISNVTPAYPTGITIDAEGTIWVTDIGKGRVAKFGPAGEFYWEWIGSSGSGKGQLSFPFGVAADLEGNIWVADTGNSRLQKFNQSGGYLGEFGQEGSGGGSLSAPLGVAVDSEGNVWAADSVDGRVKAFDHHGKYLSRFGPGSGEGRLLEPFGVSPSPNGRIWVADRAGKRIQAWTPSPANGSTSELSVEISVDGEEVYENTASCAASSCTLEPDWLLDASAYDEGEHSVEVQATDAYGRATTETLEVEIEADKADPTVEAGGELFDAPEGWVEQESYGLKATAEDSGYGVTSLVFKIDGEEVVSTNNDCPDGGCKVLLAKGIDMSAYSGGAHTAQLVAMDGAGNSTIRSWTLNVDPDGHVSSAEAIETLEAVDETSESAVVASTEEALEPGQIEAGDNPGLQVNGTTIESVGVPNTTTMTADPEDGFAIQSPDGKTTIIPIVNQGSGETKIAAGVAGVAANTKSEVDSVIRPQYNGVQTFQAIRGNESPEKFSWTVNLAAGQSLMLVDSAHAKVVYENGSIAFLITAEDAHDATGKAVPTSLEVSGNVLTLNVDFHSAQFVYPIIAGQGWETSYEVPVLVERPEDEAEKKEREEEEKLYEEGNPPEPTEVVKKPFSAAIGNLILKPRVIGPSEHAAPPYPPSGGASASKIRVFTVEPNKVCGLHCDHWWANLRNPSFIRGSNWAHWENGTEVHCSTDNAWWFELTIFPTMPEPGCGFTGPSKVWKGEGKHLTVWGRYRIGALVATDFAEFERVRYLSLQIWVWPNGFQQDYVGEWDCEGSNVPSYYC